jgi:hypothetical protein
MQKKSCSECGEPADVSLCQIVSTVGRAPRGQLCSKSTAFCAVCFQVRIELLGGGRAPEHPAAPLRGVYGVGGCLRNDIAPHTSIRPSFVKRRRSLVVLSCRLCLTACNSRQFDEVHPTGSPAR